MALHAYRNHACDSDLGSGFMYEVAEKGIMVVYGTVVGTNTQFLGTGQYGDSRNVVVVPTVLTQKPFGLLATDVVEVDLSRHCFWDDHFRDATTPCNPVKVYRKGQFKTDQIDTGLTIVPGDDLYWIVGGKFTNVSQVGQDPCGTFEGVVDDNGFVVINLDIAG